VDTSASLSFSNSKRIEIDIWAHASPGSLNRIRKVTRPRSVPAMTFSWPTIPANVMMRSATSSGVLDEFRGGFC